VKKAQIEIEITKIKKLRRRTMGTYAGFIRIFSGEYAQALQFVYRGDQTITYLIDNHVRDVLHVVRVNLDQAIRERVKHEEKQRRADQRKKGGAGSEPFKA